MLLATNPGRVAELLPVGLPVLTWDGCFGTVAGCTAGYVSVRDRRDGREWDYQPGQVFPCSVSMPLGFDTWLWALVLPTGRKWGQAATRRDADAEAVAAVRSYVEIARAA